MIIVFQSKRFKDVLEKHRDIYNQTTTLFNNVEKGTAKFSPADKVGKTNIYKKRYFEIFRLIVVEYVINIDGIDHTVYYAHTLFLKNDNAYLNTQKTEQLIDYILRNPLTNEENKEIEKIIKDKIQQEKISKQLPKLPEELERWLYDKSFDLGKSNIYETQDWSESISELEDVKAFICQILQDTIIDKNENVEWKSSDKRNSILVKHEKEKCYVLLENFITTDKHSIWMLYKAYSGERPNEKQLKDVLLRYDHSVPIDNKILLRDAKKSYPDTILYEFETWNQIQRDRSSNLALSPEEEELLQKAEFPMFINGQAGSGKSTMLFYLFAHFCSQTHTGIPIFLTYNNHLLNIAKESVIAILRNYHSYVLKESLSEERIESIRDNFFPFQGFILKKLVPPEQSERFSEDRYISFNRFKNCYSNTNLNDKDLFCKLPNKSKFSAELVWHVIRTYIKGYNYNNNHYLGADAYLKINRDDQSVTYESYKEIFVLWESWYKNFWETKGYWDDQDLIRYVLQNWTKSTLTYPVIFCDEAQDFTRIEIELLLRLSSFTKYDLQYCQNVPFAFAGDPYQSINPTGFRWENLHSIFLEKFVELGGNSLEIHFSPLSQNYRSKPAIIRFANLVQLFRKSKFDISELRPQQPWQKDEGVPPRVFILNETIHEEDIEQYERNLFIIPVDPGNGLEKEFAVNDDLLQNLLKDSNDTNLSNIMTASSAKGLEFERVILYKFGENIPVAFSKMISGEKLKDSERIELSYFFNKLYVAVTRAKNFLFIFDTENGYQKFWKYFADEKFIESLLVEELDWSKSDLFPIAKGTNDHKVEIREDKPELIAEHLENIGWQQKNSDLLKRAAQFYRMVNKIGKAIECEARAARILGEFEKAGDKFQELGKLNEAADCYWYASAWQKLVKTQVLESQRDKNRIHIAEFILEYKTLKEFIAVSNNWIGEELLNNSSQPVKKLIEKLIKKLKDDHTSNDSELLELADFCQFLFSKTSNKDFARLAAIRYHKIKNYSRAINLWDVASDQEHDYYYRAKVETSDNVNEKIIWLRRIKGSTNEILELWRTFKSNFNSDSIQIVFELLLDTGNTSEAIKVESMDLSAKCSGIRKHNIERKKPAMSDEQREVVFKYLIEPARVSETYNFFKESGERSFFSREIDNYTNAAINFVKHLDRDISGDDFTEWPVVFRLMLLSENEAGFVDFILQICSLRKKQSFHPLFDRKVSEAIKGIDNSIRLADWIKKFYETKHSELALSDWENVDDALSILEFKGYEFYMPVYKIAARSEKNEVKNWAKNRAKNRVPNHIDFVKKNYPDEKIRIRELELELQFILGGEEQRDWTIYETVQIKSSGFHPEETDDKKNIRLIVGHLTLRIRKGEQKVIIDNSSNDMRSIIQPFAEKKYTSTGDYIEIQKNIWEQDEGKLKVKINDAGKIYIKIDDSSIEIFFTEAVQGLI